MALNPLRGAGIRTARGGLTLEYSQAEIAFAALGLNAAAWQDVADRVDRDLARRMVALARARAPKQTGLLRDKIGGGIERAGVGAIFFASAQKRRANGKLAAFYGPFVERGTRAGVRGQKFQQPTGADLITGRIRSSRRTHPGTRARPFFFNSAAEALGLRARLQEEAAMRQLGLNIPGIGV